VYWIGAGRKGVSTSKRELGVSIFSGEGKGILQIKSFDGKGSREGGGRERKRGIIENPWFGKTNRWGMEFLLGDVGRKGGALFYSGK